MNSWKHRRTGKGRKGGFKKTKIRSIFAVPRARKNCGIFTGWCTRKNCSILTGWGTRKNCSIFTGWGTRKNCGILKSWEPLSCKCCFRILITNWFLLFQNTSVNLAFYYYIIIIIIELISNLSNSTINCSYNVYYLNNWLRYFSY